MRRPRPTVVTVEDAMTDGSGDRRLRTERESDDGEDDGYVHRPSGEPPASGEREFDWRGWALVATVAVAFLVAPGALLYLPAAQEGVRSLGLTLRDAYLVIPLVPAFLLGAVAVWSALRARQN